jgi:hypothetical protein
MIAIPNHDEFLLNPLDLKPWKFPNPGVEYNGVIVTTPQVCYRVDRNGNPRWTPEGEDRWCLWVSVKTDDDNYRGFCIDNNAIARAFNGRANEKNLRRWASQWKKGGRLRISWTLNASQGKRTYRGRYTSPEVE